MYDPLQHVYFEGGLCATARKLLRGHLFKIFAVLEKEESSITISPDLTVRVLNSHIQDWGFLKNFTNFGLSVFTNFLVFKRNCMNIYWHYESGNIIACTVDIRFSLLLHFLQANTLTAAGLYPDRGGRVPRADPTTALTFCSQYEPSYCARKYRN